MVEKKTLRILVVDDEPLLVRLNKRQLESAGFVVDVATDSVNALQMIFASPDKFDLMISDLTMPKMSGKELIKRVRHIAPTLPVIVFTGMKDKSIDEELNRLGVRSVIEKPVVKNELVDAVRDVLKSA